VNLRRNLWGKVHGNVGSDINPLVSCTKAPVPNPANRKTKGHPGESGQFLSTFTGQGNPAKKKRDWNGPREIRKRGGEGTKRAFADLGPEGVELGNQGGGGTAWRRKKSQDGEKKKIFDNKSKKRGIFRALARIERTRLVARG